MNGFKELEEKTLEDHTLPLGIKSNVQHQLMGMRTSVNIIEVYLNRIFDMLTGLFGGETNATANTHMLTLFVPTQGVELVEEDFLAKLTKAFGLVNIPKVLWVLPADNGVEVSFKLPSQDAAKITKSMNKGKLSELQFELR